MVEDFNLSKHFTYYEMTKTNRDNFQYQNRVEGQSFINNLNFMAGLLERVRDHIDAPLEVHSGFRCNNLNAAIGGSIGSQHTKGEACDFTLLGPETDQTIEDLFSDIIQFLVLDNVSFGQLIREKDDRGYKKSRWIHLSLGFPHRPIEKCGEIMVMNDGVYEMMRKVPQCLK